MMSPPQKSSTVWGGGALAEIAESRHRREAADTRDFHAKPIDETVSRADHGRQVGGPLVRYTGGRAGADRCNFSSVSQGCSSTNGISGRPD
ncbi:MAG: hypothetical protein CM15mP103_08300 [Gammaproteobacteria bacterium]|nr:MAG: hypothetical protein CM15mP103_08300 [Gammaproteobacteria bacterium]